MKKVVLGDDFGIAVECLSIDARDRCWNSSSTMNPIWTLENFGRREMVEGERWLGGFASCCVYYKGCEERRIRTGKGKIWRGGVGEFFLKKSYHWLGCLNLEVVLLSFYF